MSTFKNIVKEKVLKNSNSSSLKEAIVNKAGGLSFEITDASTKLITMTGAKFFAEPNYYDYNSCSSSKKDNLFERINFIDDSIDFSSFDGIDDLSVEIISTVWNICESKNPRDALAIANWLRNEMNIRTTPQVILVICSRHPATQKFIREYASKIIIRPDEVKTVLMAHRYFFGQKTIKNCLNMGIGDAISKFSEKALIKYDDSNFPKWKDILRWVKRKEGWPLTKDLARYFTHGEVSEIGTPIAYKRKLLSQKTEFDLEAQKLAKESFANWEVLSSQFGYNSEGKNKIWSFGVENDLIGYMAMLRNVRNILESKVSQKVIDKVCLKISDRDEVLKSRQLPFRFLSAYNIVSSLPGVDSFNAGQIMDAIESACDISSENVDILPGTTAIFADNSGSMNSPVSSKSIITCADAANILCGIVAKRSERAYVSAFATAVAPVNAGKNKSVLSIAKSVSSANTKGWSTNAHLCIDWLINKGIIPDRVILLSDMQCWNSYPNYSNGSLFQSWEKYKLHGGNKTWMHSIHLNGYGDSPFNTKDKKVNLISGFSEKVFNTILNTEGLHGECIKSKVPTIEQIREIW